MPSTNNRTAYSITVETNNGNGGSITLTPADGTDDTFVLTLAQAILNAPWPTAAGRQVIVAKDVISDTSTLGDFTQNPPAFA